MTFHNEVSTGALCRFDLGELWTEVMWGSFANSQCSFGRSEKQEERKKAITINPETGGWEPEIFYPFVSFNLVL